LLLLHLHLQAVRTSLADGKPRIDFELYIHYTDSPLKPTSLPPREAHLDPSHHLRMQFGPFPTQMKVEAGNGVFGDDHAVLISCRHGSGDASGLATKLPQALSLGGDSRSEAIELTRKGNEHFWKREFAKAVEFYTASLEKCALPTTLVYRGEAYIQMERFLLALHDAQHALGLDQHYGRAQGCRRKALFLLSRFEEMMALATEFDSKEKKRLESAMQTHRVDGLCEEMKVLVEKEGAVEVSGGF
jgi:tetratricopeptide (TPR) repeat protein